MRSNRDFADDSGDRASGRRLGLMIAVQFLLLHSGSPWRQSVQETERARCIIHRLPFCRCITIRLVTFSVKSAWKKKTARPSERLSTSPIFLHANRVTELSLVFIRFFTVPKRNGVRMTALFREEEKNGISIEIRCDRRAGARAQVFER